MGVSGESFCCVDGCVRVVAYRGYCNACYKRLRRSGELVNLPRAQGCSVAGCERRHKARGLCKAHYSALLAREAGACVAEGCDAPSHTRRLCTVHYAEWKVAQGRRCSVAGCDAPRHARTLCRRHSRHERNGDDLRVAAPCLRCGGVVDLAERTSTGRRRYSSTKTCAECRGWRKSSQVSMTVAELMARDGDGCSLCGGAMDPATKWPAPLAPTVDHIVPGSLGGSGEPENLAAAHFRCNSTKQSRAGWKPSA